MNGPVRKWLLLPWGQLEFGVSQQPSLLCAQMQVLEKRRKYLAACWSQHSPVMANKLNAFFILLFFCPQQLFFPPALLPHFACLRLVSTQTSKDRRNICWLLEVTKKGPPKLLFGNINIWSRKSFSMCPCTFTLELILYNLPPLVKLRQP